MGEIPDKVLVEIATLAVHRVAVGMGDLEGNDVGTIFANSIGGVHRSSPIGIADVEWNGCAWSVKTVKYKRPFRQKRVRLISGRNSPDYSLDIENPRADIQATGRAVLRIWNERVNEAHGEHDDLRIVVLMRNIETREFAIFEEEATRFVPEEYEWSYTKSKNKNIQGRHKLTGEHKFTWQFSGGQFSVFRDVPHSVRHFRIVPNVPLMEPNRILEEIQFKKSWIDIVQ